MILLRSSVGFVSPQQTRLHLFNGTELPALLQVNANPGQDGFGIGVIGAKATFRLDARSLPVLDSQEPFEFNATPKEHPLGFLPADRIVRRGEKFEVMVLGHAYSARPVQTLRVALSVGETRREIAVFGDRQWTGPGGDGAAISVPQPFVQMPLTYNRAFGGTFPVQFDADTVADVFDPINRRGRGFDARLWAESLVRTIGAPPGYPILNDYQRWLPNLEDPRALIQTPEDAPEPVGWAPAYPDIAVSHLALIRRESARLRAAEQAGHSLDALRDAHAAPGDPDQLAYHAHSDWIIDVPNAGACVRMENLMRDAPVVEFPLPRLRVVADYIIYERQGERELRPFMLVLLPDERAFYIVYAANFTFKTGPAKDRAFRLRTATGWFKV